MHSLEQFTVNVAAHEWSIVGLPELVSCLSETS